MTTIDRRHHFFIPSQWEFAAPIRELQPILEDLSCLRQWWGRVFLHVDELCAGDGSGEGRTFMCHTKGFLPYSLQFIATVDSRESNRVVFTMDGDFDGQATICAREQDGVTRVDVTWAFALCHPRLKYLAPLLRPLFIWNHRWAMRQGQRGLQTMLMDRRGGATTLTFGRPTFPHNIAGLRVPANWRV